MMRRMCLFCAVILLVPAVNLLAADVKPTAPRLSAAEIVDKNVSARGGLAAWRAVQTLEMTGKMEAGGNNRPTLPVPGKKTGPQMPAPRPAEQVQLPFVMDLKRPRMSRVELQFNGQTAIQVYDGSKGWKVRPFLNRHEVETFTPEELKAASEQSDLDGLLIDYAAKGSKVELEGSEKIEGRDTYRLKVTDKNGYTRHVWVDAETFLESKVEGTPRRLDGKNHSVATYFRDYRSVNGMMFPYLLETAVEGVNQTEKVQLERIVLNPKLDQSRFTMPR